MIAYAARRLLSAVPLLFFLSLFVFLLFELMPADAAVISAGENATPEQIEQVRENLGLNEPLWSRYFDWAGGLLHGDLGTSLFSSQSVTSTILERLPVTASLALVSMVLVVLIGLPLGVMAARHPNSWLDRGLSSFASLCMSVPPFVLGLLLAVAFGILLPWFPPTGYTSVADGGISGWLSSLVLPAIAVAAVPIAELARQTRGSFLDVLGADHVRATRAKGMPEGSVVLKHGAKNAAVPIVTVLGLQVNRILGGSVTVEFVFALPGFGALAVRSVVQQDLPMVLGIVAVSAVIVVVVNILTDLSYGLLNPRMRR